MNFLYRLFPALCLCIGIVFGAAIVSCSDSGAGSSCEDALEAADVVISKAHDALGLVSDAIDGVLTGDGDAALAANDKLNGLAETVGDDVRSYNKLADECRGS